MKTEGFIGYYQLEGWWISAFSEEERGHIEEVFQPLGASDKPLTSGEFHSMTSTAIQLLNELAGWFRKKEDKVIAYKILDKAEDLLDPNTSVLDAHFLFQTVMRLNYKDRNIEKHFEKAIEACKRQIALGEKAAEMFRLEDAVLTVRLREYGQVRESSLDDFELPAHPGYKQLAIIYEKQKRYRETVDLCLQALAEGWRGDWDARIDRCEKKISSTTS